MIQLPIAEMTAVTAVEATATSVRRVVGFGSNLIAVPLLISINAAFVPGPLLVVAWITSVVMGRLEWDHVERRAVTVMLAARLPGSVAGVMVLRMLSTGQLSTMSGALVLIAVAAGSGRRGISLRPSTLLVAGYASGFMSSTAAIGGPPVALVLQRMEAPTIRSSLAVFSVVGTPMTLLVLALFGRFDLTSVGLAADLLPGVVAGLLLGGVLANRLRTQLVRPLVLVLCTASAFYAIEQGLH